MARFVFIFFALALATGLQGCGQSRPVTIAAHVWPGYEPMFLAQSLGWLDASEVALLQTAYASESLEALKNGRADGAALTLDEVLAARESGIPLTVVLVFNISAGADVLIGRPGLERPEDLRGMRIGYESGALGALMLEKALQHAGLTSDDIVAVDLPPARHVTAWDIGLIDALVTYEPTASHLRERGGVVLFDSRQAPNLIVDVLAIRSDRSGRSQSRALRGLIAAHLRALEHFRRNPQDASFRMASRMALPAADVGMAFRGLVLPDLENNHRLLEGHDPPLLDSARALSSFMYEQGMLPQGDADLDQLLDARLLPRVDTR